VKTNNLDISISSRLRCGYCTFCIIIHTVNIIVNKIEKLYIMYNFIIQKLANTYNNCIFKLFDTKAICGTIINNSDDFDNWNFLLYDKYGINSFQHRLLLRLSMFIYKI
jgi:hypothetical protein